MKLLRWKKDQPDPTTNDPENPDLVDQDPEPPTPVATGEQIVTSTWSTKLVAAGLWVAILLGPVGAFLGWSALSTASEPATEASLEMVDRSDERARASAFADRVVVAWLSASRSDPGDLPDLVAGASNITLPVTPLIAERSSVSSIQEISDGVWSVTLAVRVTPTAPEPEEDDSADQEDRSDGELESQLWFIQVPVAVVDDSVAALSLPAVVTGPDVAGPPQSHYRTQVGSGGMVHNTVTGFLDAYLVGGSDLSRYLAPGTDLVAIAPAPFTDVTLTGLVSIEPGDHQSPEDGDEVNVLVTATAAMVTAQAVTVEYSLSMKARAGRWEITAIEAAPEIPVSPTPGDPAPPGAPPATERGMNKED